MAKKAGEEPSLKEAQRRFESAVDHMLNTVPKPRVTRRKPE